MCGIAGVVGVTDRSLAEGMVRKMVSALARRGPDDEGIEIWDRAVLGHRRLARFIEFYDVSAGPSRTRDEVGVDMTSKPIRISTVCGRESSRQVFVTL